MSYFSQISKPNVYEDYLALSDHSIDSIMLFYDDHSLEIETLDFSEKFEIKVLYVNALFESGKYNEVLRHVDWLIIKAIKENVYVYKGMDVYQHFIFRKASSLYNTRRIEQALAISKQLMLIDTHSKSYQLLLRKCILRQAYANLVTWQLIGALILAVGAVVYLAGTQYFAAPSADSVFNFQNFGMVTFIFGAAMILLPEGYYQYSAYAKIREVKKGVDLGH